MSRVILIHGWDGNPEEGWFPWFKSEMERRGFAVTIPVMRCQPPRQEIWVPQIREVVGQPDAETYLIGHSAGCISILRYLESLPDDVQIGGVVLVAGFKDDLKQEELRNYFATPLYWSKIKTKARRFIAIHSDDDRWVPLEHGDVFREKLDADIYVLRHRKHFSGESGIKELPEARDAILRIHDTYTQ